jgi:uncharacterized glyoxalase superfamily protein PhnB
MVALIEKEEAQPRRSEKQKGFYQRVRDYGFAYSAVHAEITHGDGVVMIGTEWADCTRSPASLDRKNTQRVRVRIENGIGEHCARSWRAGAKIVKEPEDQFYGDRT